MIGLFGGTFNPIHQGHLRAAEEVSRALALERVLFIPSARPPHKNTSDADPIAPAKLRLEWVELAVADNPLFAVDPIEIERSGPSFLVDTLSELGARHGADQLVFIVGQDAFSEMGSWRAPSRLFELCHIAVTTRPPVLAGHLSDWLPACVRDDIELSEDGHHAQHRESNTWIRQLPITALDICASAIRAELRAGRSVRYLMPERVRAAIEASGCYTNDPRAPGADPNAAGPEAEPTA